MKIQDFPINHELNKIIKSGVNSFRDETFSDDDAVDNESMVFSKTLSRGSSIQTDKKQVGQSQQKSQENIDLKETQLKPDFCQDHDQNFETYCLVCQEKCCYMCALFGKHLGHKMKTKEDVNRELEGFKIEYETILNQLM